MVSNMRIGHVHLRVADLARATSFYSDVLGFDVMAYGPDFGLPGAAFLSSGGYHHHIGLELGRAVRRLLDHGYPIDGAEDHGATISVYLSDPDGNGIELYYDRPRSEWFDPQGNPVIKAEPFDPRELVDDDQAIRGA
jgi:catechol 2,3-dioxygenase